MQNRQTVERGEASDAMLRATRLFAIEGGPGSGKTTTALALTARIKSMGIVADYCEEPARKSALVEDFALRGASLDMIVELFLYVETISQQILASRNVGVLVCDKTPASPLAYAKAIPHSPLRNDNALYEAMNRLFLAWSDSYDLVFVLHDRYQANGEKDLVRAKVTHVSGEVSRFLDLHLRPMESRIVEVPVGLGLDDRVAWIIEAAARILP